MKRWIFFLLILCSCESLPESPKLREVTIDGRLFRFPIYKAAIPLDWQEIKPSQGEDLSDTRKAISTYKLPNKVTVVVHNFSALSLDERIAPEAQIERWKKQSAASDFELTPFTRGGFGGFRLEVFEEKPMICYAMQLSPLLFQAMVAPGSALEEGYFKEMRADYTIKATGSKEALLEASLDIDQFAKSFRWIHPLRTPR